MFEAAISKSTTADSMNAANPLSQSPPPPPRDSTIVVDEAASERSPRELFALLIERNILQRTPEQDEMLDPIERTVRYLVPIPKRYYWDVVTTRDHVPLSIRVWHQSIASCETIGTWANDYIGQPLAAMLGLKRPRFFEVIESMTAEEFDESVKTMRARADADRALRQRNALLSTS